MTRKKHTKRNISGIINILLDELNKRLADREIKVQLTDDAINLVTDEAYEPSFGARPLKRYLQKNVETLLARAILSDRARTGDTIVIDCIEGKLGIK